MKKFFQESVKIQNLKYYIKRFFNGEILYLSVQKQTGESLGSFIFDLDLEGTFTTASAIKKLCFDKEAEIVENMKLISIKDENLSYLSLKLIEKPEKNGLKLPFPKEDFSTKKLKMGDIFIRKEKESKENSLNIALEDEIKENIYEKIRAGHIINLNGFSILKEINKSSQLKNEGNNLFLEEFFPLRNKFLIKFLNYYVVCSILGIFFVHYYYSDSMLMPLINDQNLLTIPDPEK